MTAWQRDIAPNLSPATVRQRESYLRTHILPRFGDSALHTLDVVALQRFATDSRKVLSRKTVINVLGAVFVILQYAEKSGSRVAKVSFRDVNVGEATDTLEEPSFTKSEAVSIIRAAEQPFKTIFAIAWLTGLRAGEDLALTVADLDFAKKRIRVNKSSDDRTREIRPPKTPKSSAHLPMPSALEEVLRDYQQNHWQANALGLLFPNHKGTKPRCRDTVVRYHLHPPS